MSFKELFNFNARCQFAQNHHENPQNEGHVPFIIQKVVMSQLENIPGGFRHSAKREISLGKFVALFRKEIPNIGVKKLNICIEHEVNKQFFMVHPDPRMTLKDIDQKFKQSDGLVYIFYSEDVERK